jgi:hypothetical protein
MVGLSVFKEGLYFYMQKGRGKKMKVEMKFCRVFDPSKEDIYYEP